MSDLKQIIDKHLKGIDEDNRNDDSWFPTSDGAEFGRVTKETLTKELTKREASLANVIHNFLSVTNFDSSSASMEDTRKHARAILKSLGIEGESHD